MTLCISYVTKAGNGLSISDSLLTTIRNKPESGSFLPSDYEIVHQSKVAVKQHNITGVNAYSSDSIDIAVSIAGNVSLGLQCAIHLESYLRYGYNLWYPDIIYTLQEKMYEFWDNARDKQIQMSFSLCDHKWRPNIIECKADDHDQLTFIDVPFMDDFKLSVIGDESEDVKNHLLSNLNSLLYKYELDDALKIASISTLQKRIDDPTKIFIGGCIQGSEIKKIKSSYLVFDYGNKYFRGAEISGHDELELNTINIFKMLHLSKT